MYNTNGGGSNYVGVTSQYVVREYVARPPRKIANERVRYEVQEHNPARYRWK